MSKSIKLTIREDAVSNHSYVLDELLVRPRPNPDENDRGYRLRLAQLNGIPSPAWLEEIQGIGKYTNSAGHTRWCPACLSEANPYWRSSWEKDAPICLRHLCWLTDSCNECNRALSWRNVRLLTCNCDHPLIETIAENLPNQIKALLINPSKNNPNSWWHDISIQRRLAVAHFLGALHVHGLLGKPLKRASLAAVTAEKNILTIGSEILIDDESGFHNLLDRIRIHPNSNSTCLLMNEAFPGLLLKMRRQLFKAEYEVLASYIRSAISADIENDIAVVWRGNSKSFQGAVACVKDLNVGLARFKEILSAHGVSPKARRYIAGRDMSVIGSVEMQHIKKEMQASLSFKAASQIYGISPTRLKMLIKNDFIRSIGEKVDRNSVHDFLERVSSLCVQRKIRQTGEFQSLELLLRTAIPIQMTAPFFQELFNGKITIRRASIDCQRLREFEISITDVQVILQKTKLVSDDCISIVDAAEILKLKQEVVYHLVNQGLIKVVDRKFGKRSARFIQKKELNRFVKEVEPLTSAAKRFGLSHQGALKWAQAKNLRFISGPTLDGGRQYFVQK